MNDCVDFAFLDSGTGGLPYMLTLKDSSPLSRCVYVGDTEHFPYGEKSEDDIASCAAKVIERMVSRWQPRVVVIACNTMSVTALHLLRARFKGLAIVGTVPAIKLAATVSQTRRIGLLATRATVVHPYCARLIDEFASDCTIVRRADGELISFIERRLFLATDEERLQAALPAARYFAENMCDTVVLGCTHFTHMADDIGRACDIASGKHIAVVDSRNGVSKRALDVLDHLPVRTTFATGEPIPKDMTFYVTKLKTGGDKAEYEMLCKSFAIPFGGIF